MFVVDIVMPFDDVDSNVHPSKTEVRFRDKHSVFSAVYHAVKETVENSLRNVKFGFSIPSESISDNELDMIFNAEPVKPEKPVFEQSKIDTSSIYNLTHKPARRIDYSLPNFDNELANSFGTNEPLKVFDGKIVGQIFDTYIIVERDDLVYIIDQHAAHERILYDKLVDKFSVEHVQSLIVPYKLQLTAEESEYVDSIIDKLAEFGFEIENKGGDFLVNAVPEPVANISLDKFFKVLLHDLNDEKPLKLTDVLREKLCQTACKAAIKGGESLNREQIERVLKNYLDENGDLPAQCPHGRPAVVAFTKADIEKMFKRIV